MKLPGWMASMATALVMATDHVGVRFTTCGPLSVFTVREVSVMAATVPRTTVGVGGVAGGGGPGAVGVGGVAGAGAQAKALPAASVSAASPIVRLLVALVRIMDVSPCCEWRVS